MADIVTNKETAFCSLLKKTDDGFVQIPAFIWKCFRVMNKIECLNHKEYQVNELLVRLDLI